MVDPEFESFKAGIDLRAYAASEQYALDVKESCRGAAVMRHPNGDKIIIKRDAVDGHYMYFSVRDDQDNGTIIDFVQKRKGMSLGAVRKELRPWIGLPSAVLPPYPPLPRTAKDRIRVEREYARTQDALRHPYLENERNIPAAILGHDRFAGRVRIDSRSNAVFPHFDLDGLCGFELKNKNFTGFATGGTKGLWQSHVLPEDRRIVFCESSIDALSYAVLFPDDHTRYASIGGQINPSTQPELIRAAIGRVPPLGSEVVAAMDADEAGRKLANEVVRRAFDLSGRRDLRFTVHEPSGAKDWNDVLQARPKPASPSRQEELSVG